MGWSSTVSGSLGRGPMTGPSRERLSAHRVERKLPACLSLLTCSTHKTHKAERDPETVASLAWTGQEEVKTQPGSPNFHSAIHSPEKSWPLAHGQPGHSALVMQQSTC